MHAHDHSPQTALLLARLPFFLTLMQWFSGVVAAALTPGAVLPAAHGLVLPCTFEYAAHANAIRRARFLVPENHTPPAPQDPCAPSAAARAAADSARTELASKRIAASHDLAHSGPARAATAPPIRPPPLTCP